MISFLQEEAGLDTRTEQLRKRTKDFAVRIVYLFRSLPNTAEAQIIGRQLLHSGTAVGANYHAACRARSKAEFVSKIGIVTEEADESVFWIELLSDVGVIKKERLEDLLRESRELTAIFSASRQTAKGR
ncbi:MAG TPA: four helix bundle protein [Candidatus Angelobacter sp.]|nr:four helix bundle protein [Candidatus Angelobacter sp.]